MSIEYARVTGTATSHGGLAVTAKVVARPLTTDEILRHPDGTVLVGRYEGLVYPDGTVVDGADRQPGLRIPLGVIPANPWFAFDLQLPDPRLGVRTKFLGSAIITGDIDIDELLAIQLTAVSQNLLQEVTAARAETLSHRNATLVLRNETENLRDEAFESIADSTAAIAASNLALGEANQAIQDLIGFGGTQGLGLDTDGQPYFDPTMTTTPTLALLIDDDGVPYILGALG